MSVLSIRSAMVLCSPGADFLAVVKARSEEGAVLWVRSPPSGHPPSNRPSSAGTRKR